MDAIVKLPEDDSVSSGCISLELNSPTSSIHDNQVQHFAASFEAMNQMRKAGQLCDVTLVVDKEGVELLAHKLVLASSSAYFNAMFNSKFEFYILKQL